jgi:hypothetical protein
MTQQLRTVLEYVLIQYKKVPVLDKYSEGFNLDSRLRYGICYAVYHFAKDLYPEDIDISFDVREEFEEIYEEKRLSLIGFPAYLCPLPTTGYLDNPHENCIQPRIDYIIETLSK